MAKTTKTTGKKNAPVKAQAKKAVKAAARKTAENKKIAPKAVAKKKASIKPASVLRSKGAPAKKHKKNTPTRLDTIPVFYAVSFTEAWQRFNEHPHHSKGTSDYIRAFKLPLLDITHLAKMAKKNKFIAYRAYLGIGMLPSITMPDNPTHFMKMMLVGIKKNSANEEYDYVIDSAGNSCVFDLSTPCPNTCDHKSVLYQK